jgi:hypothetical protein
MESEKERPKDLIEADEYFKRIDAEWEIFCKLLHETTLKVVARSKVGELQKCEVFYEVQEKIEGEWREITHPENEGNATEFYLFLVNRPLFAGQKYRLVKTEIIKTVEETNENE